MVYFSDVNMAHPVAGAIEILNRLRAAELVAAEQYYNHEVKAKGPNAIQLAELWKIHAEEELAHADKLKDRIAHLGGTLENRMEMIPLLNPAALEGDGDVQTADSVSGMLRLDLEAESMAIAMYEEACRILRDVDPATWLTLVEILRDEYEHRHEFGNLLA